MSTGLDAAYVAPNLAHFFLILKRNEQDLKSLCKCFFF